MEPTERKSIDCEKTKSVIKCVLALEMRYGIAHCVAIDGSSDTHPAQKACELGADAAAWGSWDGMVARGTRCRQAQETI